MIGPARAIGPQAQAPQKLARRPRLDRLELDPDRPQGRGRGDHRLDRDPHRGGALEHRPDGLDRGLLRRPQGRRARRRGPPLRPREDREPRGGDRGDADPGRGRDDHLRGRPAAGGHAGGGVAGHRHRGDRVLGRCQRRRARATSTGRRALTDSPALEADAAHLRTDAATSAGVLVALVLVQVTGVEWLDPAVALVVAVAIVAAGVRILSRTSRVLVDEALPDDELDAVRAAIDGHGRPRGRRASTSCAPAAPAAAATSTCTCSSRTGTTLRRAHELAHELQGEIRDAGARRGRADPPGAGERQSAPSSEAISSG